MSWFNRERLTRLFRPASSRRSTPEATQRARLRVDALEDRTVPAAGDMFADAIVLTGTSASAFASTTDATGETGEPNHAGAAGTLNSVWFKWTAPFSGGAEIDTAGSGFDTVLAVYTGTDLGNLQLVTSNDDAIGVQSRVTFKATAGTTYYIAVDGFEGETGEVSLNLVLAPAPVNDDFASALDVTTGTYTGSNIGATGESGEPTPVSGAAPLNSVWYRWEAPADGMVDFNTHGSGFDTVMGVYTGDTVAGLAEVGVSDDDPPLLTSRVSFQAQQGVVYYIQVDGYNDATGNIVFNVNMETLPPPPPPPPSNTAPVVADQTFAVAENSAAATAVGTVAATDDPAQTLTYQIVGGTGAGLFVIDAATGAISVAPGAALNFEAVSSYSLVVRVTDNAATPLTSEATVTVNLTDVNDAPVLAGSAPSLGEVGWLGSNSGTRVADLLAGRVSDEDAGAVQGIAITAANTQTGWWQFSTNGGATWQNLGSVSNTNARLLTADARVRFVSFPAQSGTIANALTFRAWDQTSGTAGGFANTTVNGGSSAFSAATLTASIRVLTPREQLDRLLLTVESTLETANLTTGPVSSVETLLVNAQKKLDQGNENAAVNNIQSFVNQIQTLVTRGRLSSGAGLALAEAAQEIIASIRA